MGNSAIKSHIANAEKTGTFSLQNSGLKEVNNIYRIVGCYYRWWAFADMQNN